MRLRALVRWVTGRALLLCREILALDWAPVRDQALGPGDRFLCFAVQVVEFFRGRLAHPQLSVKKAHAAARNTQRDVPCVRSSARRNRGCTAGFVSAMRTMVMPDKIRRIFGSHTSPGEDLTECLRLDGFLFSFAPV